jgi:uncharacterized protein (DUF433 family)
MVSDYSFQRQWKIFCPEQTMGKEWKNQIVIDPEILTGKPLIKGTRISVEFVIDLLARGWSTKKILDEYKHLKEDDVQACLAYVDDYR